MRGQHMSRIQMIVGAWGVAALVAVLATLELGAAWSTSLLVLILVGVPLAIAAIVGLATPPLTIAELIHSVDGAARRG